MEIMVVELMNVMDIWRWIDINLFVFKNILTYFLLMDDSILDETPLSEYTAYDDFVNNTWYWHCPI